MLFVIDLATYILTHSLTHSLTFFFSFLLIYYFLLLFTISSLPLSPHYNIPPASSACWTLHFRNACLCATLQTTGTHSTTWRLNMLTHHRRVATAPASSLCVAYMDLCINVSFICMCVFMHV